MGFMTDSMAQASGAARATSIERPGWKTALGWICALLLALLFLVSGVWKLTDPQSAAMRMAQVKIPESLSLAAALLVGIAETLAGALVVVPRFRRWGALLAAFLLVAFMIYVGLEYSALQGDDCSCFPWVKRAVGPMFFIGDAVMLLMAVAAAVWSRRPAGLRGAVLALGAIVVFALASYGVNAVTATGTRAPATIQVSGKPYSLERGKVFLFFFHPECMHCFEAARRMSQLHWGASRVVAVPVAEPQYAAQFLADTGLAVPATSDFATLKQVFGYTTYPWGVALENGRQKAALTKFDGAEPVATLKGLGFAD